MRVAIPELSLVVLIGASGSGKSTFAREHFLPTEVLSSDTFRGLVADDENDQTVSRQAFEALHAIAAKRLEIGRLCVVDATNVQREARAPLVRLARDHHVLPVAIVLDLPERLCQERTAARADRNFGPHVVRTQRANLRRSLRGLEREGFRRVHVLRTPEDVASVGIVREPAWTDRRGERGPFDLIGDVHGCLDELRALLRELGWEIDDEAAAARHPDGRTAVFLGDLVDRGPDTPGVLRLAMNMVEAGTAIVVPGNHEHKLLRALKGRNVQISHGLGESLEQLETAGPEFRERVATFLDGLIGHFVLDGGGLVVAHAGMKEAMQGRASAAVRSFALYGETTGETDEFGLPVRYPWAEDYRGSAAVVYGHTPVPEPRWLNNTICVDTGCVFGGGLTALRWPERELVSVGAARTYYEPAKPFLREGDAAPALDERTSPALLDIDDVLGKRVIDTRLMGTVTIREENATAALEVMSRFAVDPRWLVYLPPTMSPTSTEDRGPLLEHPRSAFGSYRAAGVPSVICEEKHMGSRAVVMLARSPEDERAIFGVGGDESGVCVTRTGRPFFADRELGRALLSRVAAAAESVGLWDELESPWMVMDAELLPWSLKAEELLRRQYAAVGAAGRASLAAAVAALDAARGRGLDLEEVAERQRSRLTDVEAFVEAYRPYCWDVRSIDDVRLAPFQLLASAGRVHVERDHSWHMGLAQRLAEADPGLIRATRNLVVDVTEEGAQTAGVAWWEALVAEGGEGMVVKPLTAIARGQRGLTQPGIKVRGPEYLRIIYGPEYTEPANLERLRSRALGHKRALALREFALGVEALERFVRGEPLHRVHECVFGVLALESEPVDPRL
jgi:protein phosphatase